jgi:hypothetical protein
LKDYTNLAMSIGQVDPAIMDNIDHDEAVRLRGKLLGVPKTVLRGKDLNVLMI